MPTSEQKQRQEYFDRAIDTTINVLSNPDLFAPNHPYIPKLMKLASSAVMATPHRGSSTIEIETTGALPAVAILPLLPVDLEHRHFEVRQPIAMLKEGISYDIHAYKNIQSDCCVAPQTRIPLITLAAGISQRPDVQLGAALSHELDHVYRARQPGFLKYSIYAGSSLVKLEVSAYRLEDEIFRANDSPNYGRERNKVFAAYARRDLLARYRAQDSDAYRRNVRAIAFYNLLLDRMGIQVGAAPTARDVAIFRAHDLI